MPTASGILCATYTPQEEPDTVNITDFITELFCKVDDAIADAPRHSQAILSVSEVVTIGILYVVKGVSQRAFYPWLKDNYGGLFPQLPERTRLFRRLHTQQYWTGRFLAQPTLMGIADRYGIELRHPIRDGRRAGQIGRKGISNHRWIAGGKLCAVVNKFGLICDWDCATANVQGQTFHPLLQQYDGQMIVLADWGFHRAAGDPANVMICRRGQWNVRMMVETVFSMMSVKWDFKVQRHRAWEGFEAHLAYAMAGFNILAQWNGLEPYAQGRVHLSIAQFTL